MRTTLTLDGNRSLVMIESLLATIDKNQADYEFREARDAADVTAASILRRFFVECHPELTKELSEFVLERAKQGEYPNTVAGCIKVLDYHDDTVDDKTLDAVLTELKAMAKTKK